MYFQREYEREGVSMDLNDTYRLDLPEHGLLGSLMLRITGSQATGLGQSGGSWRIQDFISEIEVILNGAEVCKSYKGDMVQAIAFLDQGVPSPDRWRNYATNMQSCYFLINFGRILFDPRMQLDLGNFSNVELRIKNSATSSEFSDLTVSVLKHLLKDPPAEGPLGYMRTEQWRKWTTVADETKYFDIPVQHPIRRLILQAIPNVDSDKVEKTNMFNLMDDVDLAFDTGAVRVYKGGLDDLVHDNFLDLGKLQITQGSEYMNADKGVNIGLGFVLGGSWGAGSQDGAAAATNATMETGRTSFTQKPETYESDSPIGFMFSGIGYQNIGFFRFDYDKDPATWLDPKARETVELNIHTRNISDAADGTNRVILDRFVKPAA